MSISSAAVWVGARVTVNELVVVPASVPDGAQGSALEEFHIEHIRATVGFLDHEVVVIASRLETEYSGVGPGERVPKGVR